MSELVIDRSLRLPDDQYVKVKADFKDLLVLHHTVGGSAESTYRWWLRDPARVGTAYIVERDGKVFEVFDPEYWCYHLKVGDPEMDARSIGIELASEGALTRVGEWLYAFDGKKRLYSLVDDKEKYYDHGDDWRGYQYFDAYDDAQIESVIKLADYLIEKFGIPRRMPANHLAEARTKLWDFKGIIGHHHVRADKTDLHPGFGYDHFRRMLNLEEV